MKFKTGDILFATVVALIVGLCSGLLLSQVVYSSDPGAGKDWDCKGNGKGAVVMQNSDFTTYGDVCVRKDES